MQRIIEPELMDDREQAAIYAQADFEAPHNQVIKRFGMEFPEAQIKGNVLDLGCGPGDISFRFAYRFPKAKVIGIDGAKAMITLACERKKKELRLGERISFIEGLIPGPAIPSLPYEVIISNSLLHHLHNPQLLWETIIQHTSIGTKIFIVDLLRPGDTKKAEEIVNKYAADEPSLLKKDFYNSLLAAFEPEEVEAQLARAELTDLTVKVISDRHLLIYGERGRDDQQQAGKDYH